MATTEMSAPQVERSRVVDEILPLVPVAEEAALGHAQIWRLANRWSQSAVRLALIELDQRGVVSSRIVHAHNGVPRRVYWRKPDEFRGGDGATTNEGSNA